MTPKKKKMIKPWQEKHLHYIIYFTLHFNKYYFFINFYYSPKSFLPPSMYMSKEVKMLSQIKN